MTNIQTRLDLFEKHFNQITDHNFPRRSILLLMLSQAEGLVRDIKTELGHSPQEKKLTPVTEEKRLIIPNRHNDSPTVTQPLQSVTEPSQPSQTVTEPLQCLFCNGSMEGKKKTAKFCCDKCRTEYHRNN